METFNDGVMEICRIEGKKITGTIVKDLRFGKRTVGVTRFFQARIASTDIDMLISVPFNKIVKKENLALIDGVQYEIEQLQEKYDTDPTTMYLTLRRARIAYADERSKDEVKSKT